MPMDAHQQVITLVVLLTGIGYLAFFVNTMWWRLVYSFAGAVLASRLLIQLRRIRGKCDALGRVDPGGIENFLAFLVPWIVFAFSASLILGATVVAGLLDLATRALGSTMGVATGFISFFTWLVKIPFSLITPAIGLLIGIVGIIIGAARGFEVKFNFIGGAMFFKMGANSPNYYATTFCWVVNVWKGHISDVVDHELYHTRQYIYLRDMLGVFYFTIAGLWGIISSAIVAAIDKTKSFDITHYFRSDGDVGNPIECLAYKRWS